jgi:hypothetical protein
MMQVMPRSQRRALALLLVAGCSNATAPSDLATPFGSGAPLDLSVHIVDLSVPIADASAPDLALVNGCPSGMARIADFCVDRWEAHVVDLDVDGGESPHSPFLVIGGAVRAKTAPGVFPQGYISQLQATDACRNAGKRLCSAAEFALACRGSPDMGDGGTNYYPYGGTADKPGWCNESKGSSMPRFFGNDASRWTYAEFNDPRLNQWDGGLAPTASYPHCVSPFGVWDCMGNLHEWGSDAADANGHGRFRGGFYGDAEINGPGCLYVTSAHELAYHDYSTGFRCCSAAVK